VEALDIDWCQCSKYHLPFEKKRINKLIDHAIIEAEQEGAREIVVFPTKIWEIFGFLE
jgi:hypothetical protein